MQSKMRTMVMVSLLAALGGCAGTAVNEQGPARLTYTWEADDRATRLAFHETHQSCTKEESVPAYEACMIRNGFARADY